MAVNNDNRNGDSLLHIYHYKIPCAGESIQMCYLLDGDKGQRQYFHGVIDGFNYEWGYNYTIAVEKIYNSKPKSDEPSFGYKFKKLVKKEKALKDETFELPLKMDGRSLIERKEGSYLYFGGQAIITGSHSWNEIVSAQSAIFSHAAGKSALVLIKLL